MLFPVTLFSLNFSKMLRNSICQWAARVAKRFDCSYSEEDVRELVLLPLGVKKWVSVSLKQVTWRGCGNGRLSEKLWLTYLVLEITVFRWQFDR